MKNVIKAVKSFAAAAVIGVAAMPAQSGVIELALVLDASGSMSSSEFNLQKSAYANIFGSGTFYDDYVVGGDDLWVSSWKFAESVSQEQTWTLINDNASAAAFGATFASISQSGVGSWTNTASAVVEATASILGNAYSGKGIIDISTDGVPTRCAPNCFGQPNNGSGSSTAAISAATDASNNGVTVNAIGVGNGINAGFLNSFTTAGGGFYSTAANFNAFQTALETKLFREINAPVSEPATLALLMLGLAGLASARRKAA